MRIDETKPGQPDDDELTVLARRLGRISLSTQPTERDHLMFQCGQAAAVAQASTPSSEKKLWFSIAACMLVAFGGGTLVGHNSSTTSGAAVTQKNLTTKQVDVDPESPVEELLASNKWSTSFLTRATRQPTQAARILHASSMSKQPTNFDFPIEPLQSIQASDAPPIRAGQWSIYSDSSSTPKS